MERSDPESLICAIPSERNSFKAQALHAKLDEPLRVHGGAEGLTQLDEGEPEQVEAFRSRARGAD
jgi:hypothetical protein